MIHWLGALSILKNTAFIEMWMNDWYYYLLQLSRIKHIRFDSMMMIKLIIPWFVTHWYTNKWMIDWLLDWSNGKSSMIPNPIQFNRIWSNSSLVAVIIQLFSLFIVYSELFLINEAKSMSYFNLNDCIALSTCLQWIHKWNNHQISIHSNHSIVSLSNPIF